MKTVALFLLLAGALTAHAYTLADESLPGETVNTELMEDDEAWERNLISKIEERALTRELSEDDVNDADKHLDVSRRGLSCSVGECEYCKRVGWIKACLIAKLESGGIRITIKAIGIYWSRLIKGRSSYSYSSGRVYLRVYNINYGRASFCVQLRIKVIKLWRKWRYLKTRRCFRLR